MITLFRLEDANGNGPFVYRDGRCRFDTSIRFNDVGLFGFTDKARFKEPSYKEAYESDEFTLYEIVVSNIISQHNGQVVFSEQAILIKNIAIKD